MGGAERDRFLMRHAASMCLAHKFHLPDLTKTCSNRREVRLVLEGVDKFNNMFATLFVPPAPGAPGEAKEDSLAELLVRAGYAKVSSRM